MDSTFSLSVLFNFILSPTYCIPSTLLVPLLTLPVKVKSSTVMASLPTDPPHKRPLLSPPEEATSSRPPPKKRIVSSNSRSASPGPADQSDDQEETADAFKVTFDEFVRPPY
jgi:hypothetical protein